MKQLCGLRPTGRLHVGHYFAVIEPAFYGADILIATYHAPNQVHDVIPTLIKFGVRPSQIIMQEEVFNPTLYFRLLSIAPMGELERMTQYKSSDKQTAHLLVYPVLMVHDVCNYDEVIVGEDQSQHLEYARVLLKRYNNHYHENVKIPVAKPIAGRIMSLSDPTKKMSKSEPNGCLFLDDTEADIRKKVRKAVADEAGRANLIDLYQKFGGSEVPEMNSDLKDRLSDLLVEKFKRV